MRKSNVTTEQFYEWLETWGCPEGRNWVSALTSWARRQERPRPSLSVLWRACKKGNWMAYWLVHGEPHVYFSAVKLLQPGYLDHGMYTGSNWTKAEQKQFADNLRKHFNADGTRRETR